MVGKVENMEQYDVVFLGTPVWWGREALRSSLFTALRSGDILLDDHEGICDLYEKRGLVEALLAQNQ